MRLIYLTLIRFEKVNADTAYISSMADAFNKSLGDKFILTMTGKSPEQFKEIKTHEFNLGVNSLIYYRLPSFFYQPIIKLSYILFFLYFPFYARRNLNYKEQIIFSSDSNLLTMIIFWKKVFFYKYNICSDWHMLFNNLKNEYIVKNSDYLITTSTKLKKSLAKKFGAKEDKILVAYGGIDLEKFKNITKEQARIKLGLPINKKLVGYIGLFTTMRMEKGIGTMVESLKHLDNDIAIILVGRREREGVDYGRLAEENGVADRCIIKDFVNYERMILYEQAMDILVIPYPDKPHYREYGFPMKVYEYMASKRPIIYSRLELVEEIIGDYGYSFIPDDPKDLAECTKRIFLEYGEAEARAERACESVKEYSWEKKAEKIINFIK